ncbi:hypothetical protein [Rathayibacter sp. AY1E9]|uniref:hypothetical protein n=1 Tax=Rathayibacter sp. AY1E9 TaxID=2080556 RepID=UPI0011B0744C|nr:hypothetical protein [Rathayibacter sp. AY1E9]
MAKGLNLDIAMNTREVLRGAKESANAFELVADSLDDLVRESNGKGDDIGDGLSDGVKTGVKDAERSVDRLTDAIDDSARDADRTGRKIGDGLSDGVKDGTKDSERAVEKLETTFRDMADKVKRESKSAGSSLGDEVKRGANDASDGLKEVGDEATSTAKEAAASFDGSAQSIGDAFQEVAANAFAGFGPAGVLAGVAAAAGIGVVIAKLEEGGEDSEAFRQKIADLTSELIEVGNEGGPSLDYLVGKLQEMATATDEGGESLSDLYKISDSAASGFDKIAQAYAGNTEGLDELIEKEKDHKRALEDEAAAIDTTKETSYGAALSRAEDSQVIVDGLEKARTAAQEAQLAEDAYIAAGGPELEAKAERTATYADSIQEELADVGESWETYRNAETGAIDLAAYTAALTERVAAMDNYRANMNTLHGTISDDAYNYLVSMGADAAPLISAYVAAPLDQKQKTAEVWGTLGRTGGQNYNSELQKEIPDRIPGPAVGVTVDSSAYDRFVGGIPKRIGGPAITMRVKEERY